MLLCGVITFPMIGVTRRFAGPGQACLLAVAGIELFWMGVYKVGSLQVNTAAGHTVLPRERDTVRISSCMHPTIQATGGKKNGTHQYFCS